MRTASRYFSVRLAVTAPALPTGFGGLVVVVVRGARVRTGAGSETARMLVCGDSTTVVLGVMTGSGERFSISVRRVYILFSR
jgi:hypothetical protein